MHGDKVWRRRLTVVLALSLSGCLHPMAGVTAKQGLPGALDIATDWDPNAALVSIQENQGHGDGRSFAWSYLFADDHQSNVFEVEGINGEYRIVNGSVAAAGAVLGDFRLDSDQVFKVVRTAVPSMDTLLAEDRAQGSLGLWRGSRWACDDAFWQAHDGPVWRVTVDGTRHETAFVDAQSGLVLNRPPLAPGPRQSDEILLHPLQPSAAVAFDPKMRCGQSILWSLRVPGGLLGHVVYNLTDGQRSEQVESDFGGAIGPMTLQQVVHAAGRPWTATVRMTSEFPANFTMAWQAIPKDASEPAA